MAKKHKRKQKSFVRPGLVAVLVGVGVLGLGLQAQADLSGHLHIHALGTSLVLAAPSVSLTPKPATPTPVVTPKPTPVAHAVAPKVAVIRKPKTVPAVKPVPNSSVSHLVAVQQPPTGSPGKGGATGSSSPTPTSSPSVGGTSPPTFAYTSSNWSGYLASDASFSAVNGSWTVPNVRGNGFSTSADATWIGIGGVTSNDLIQVGTDDTVSRNGQVSSVAFYEMLPATETPVPGMTVTPGDAMRAALTQLSGTQWQISITDDTRGESFTTTVSYASSNSTAEWIEEDPSFAGGRLIEFDNFGSVNFSGATTTENGATATLTGAGAQAILLVNGFGQTVATPSAIFGNGESFGVTGGG